MVNAFVDATPISGPAYVYKTESDSLGIELPFAFTMESIFAFFFLAVKLNAV